MQSIKIKTGQGSAVVEYDLLIGRELLKSFRSFFNFEKYSKLLLVADEGIKNQIWFADFCAALKSDVGGDLPLLYTAAGEKSKTLDSAAALWKQMQELGVNRKTLTISIGGGAVCDLNGFVSGTFMRGLAFGHVPTTLLSQVDASIGGKVGINFAEIKNLIGVFAQPAAVIIDIDTLSTLPDRELNAGFAEVIKHGLIRDKTYYNKVKSAAEHRKNSEFLEETILQSCRIKADVVRKDVKEAGMRKILNFGHTIGHALESISQRLPEPLLHGEAVALGMIAEAKISEFLGFLDHKEVLDIEQTVRTYDLPARIKFTVEHEELMDKIRSDKKNTGAQVNWTLLAKIGKANFDQQVSQDQIKEAVKYITHE